MHFSVFMQLLAVIVAQLTDEVFGYASGWFPFRLLINPGLSPAAVASTSADCINLCVEAGNCSAVSYSLGLQQCVLSQCAILHMVKNTGWNTFVLYSYPIETNDYSAPMFEWMLTDACSLRSTGSLPGMPDMNFTGAATYQPSLSNYVGNAASSVSNVTYLCTGKSSVFNVDFYTSGYTMSGWYYFNSLQSSMLFAFANWTGDWFSAGTDFRLYPNGSLYYYLWENPTIQTGSTLYTQPAKVWTHLALTYNPSMKTISFYVNGSMVSYSSFTGSSPSSRKFAYNVVAVSQLRTYTDTFLDGKYYCIRFHLKPLLSADIQANSLACNGRIRFT